jgi:hypothetical protein
MSFQIFQVAALGNVEGGQGHRDGLAVAETLTLDRVREIDKKLG